MKQGAKLRKTSKEMIGLSEFLTLGNGVNVGMVGGSITTLPDPDPLISCC